jgi:hypothetical protein
MTPKKEKLEPWLSKFEEIATEVYVKLSDGTELRTLQVKAPKETANGLTLFLAAGWSSIVPTWDVVVLEAMKYFDIVYFESREKNSSKLNWKTKNTLDRISEDVPETINFLNLQDDKLVILASSWGVIYIAHALAKKKINPLLTVLVGVTAKLTLPKGTRPIIPFTPPFVLTIVKPLLRYWLVNRKSESEEQAKKNLRNLEEAHPRKWKKVVRYSTGDQCDSYAKIEQKVVIFGAELDKMHSFEETQKIVNLIKNVTYIDLQSNKNIHSEVLVTEIRKILKKM